MQTFICSAGFQLFRGRLIIYIPYQKAKSLQNNFPNNDNNDAIVSNDLDVSNFTELSVPTVHNNSATATGQL